MFVLDKFDIYDICFKYLNEDFVEIMLFFFYGIIMC